MSSTGPRFPSRLFLALLAGALSAPVSAQLHDWSSTSLSALSPSATVALEQSWASVQDGNHIQIFSCFTRKWSTLRTTFGAPTIEVCNEHIVFKDGPVFYGYSSRTGRFVAQLAFSPTARVIRRVSPQSWLSVVVDDNRVHVFQGIEGVWTTHVFSQPPTVTLATKCALIQDGSQMFGVSAFYGTTVPLAIPGATAIGAYGNCGIAYSPGLVYGFSAYRNTWDFTVLANSPTVQSGHQQAAFVSLQDGNEILFFSGHTGRFTALPKMQHAPQVQLSRAIGTVIDGATLYGYSGLVGKVDKLVLALPPLVTPEQFFALVDDSSQVWAFSATTGSFSKPVAAKTAEISNRAEMALYTPAATGVPALAYSQYLNQWTPTPALAAATAYQTATSVILVEPAGGLHGLSVRGTAWKHVATPIIDTAYVGTNRPAMEMTFVAKSGVRLWAFNHRVEAWRATMTSAPATSFSGNNTAVIALDGINAYGFSSWSDRWSVQPLGGAVARFASQVQSAYVDDGSDLHVYTAVGQMSTSHEYPEYWRVASLGSRIRVDLAAEPGALGVLALGLAPAEFPLGSHGTLLIDPTGMLLLGLPTLPQDGTFGMSLQVPDDPAFSGLDLIFQSFVVRPTTFYLTNAVAVRAL